MNIKLTGFLAVTALAVSCGQKQDGPGAAMQQSGPAPMAVIEVVSRTLTGYDVYPVKIEGTVNSNVFAKVSGYITDVLVDEGQYVSKGQLLFKLETQSMSEDANAAKANVEAAQVRVNQLIPLVEKNIISEIQLETAKAQLAQAKAGYQSVLANIGYANIKSPVSGYVGKISFRTGTLVSPASPQPLTVVSQTDNVYAYFSMNEIDYLNFLQNAKGNSLPDKIKNFPPVQLRMSNGEIYSENGQITTVTGQIDPATGTVSFRATFPNRGHILANGSSGEILISHVYEDATIVPDMSSYEQQGRTMVYKVVGDTLAEPLVIEELNRIDNNILVKSGLEPGDKIIAVGADRLFGATLVTPQMMPYDSVASSVQTIFTR